MPPVPSSSAPASPRPRGSERRSCVRRDRRTSAPSHLHLLWRRDQHRRSDHGARRKRPPSRPSGRARPFADDVRVDRGRAVPREGKGGARSRGGRRPAARRAGARVGRSVRRSRRASSTPCSPRCKARARASARSSWSRASPGSARPGSWWSSGPARKESARFAPSARNSPPTNPTVPQARSSAGFCSSGCTHRPARASSGSGMRSRRRHPRSRRGCRCSVPCGARARSDPRNGLSRRAVRLREDRAARREPARRARSRRRLGDRG